MVLRAGAFITRSAAAIKAAPARRPVNAFGAVTPEADTVNAGRGRFSHVERLQNTCAAGGGARTAAAPGYGLPWFFFYIILITLQQ
jgi:hypothetical protein